MTWATSVLILVFLRLFVLDLGPMYATDRRQIASSLNTRQLGRGHKKELCRKYQLVRKSKWIYLVSN